MNMTVALPPGLGLPGRMVYEDSSSSWSQQDSQPLVVKKEVGEELVSDSPSGRTSTAEVPSPSRASPQHAGLPLAVADHSTSSASDGDADLAHCPFCEFTSSSRFQFEKHVAIHYSHKCTLCDFSDKDLEKLRTHLKEEHEQYMLSPEGCGDGDISMDGEDDEPGLRIPRVNSQGKVKTFRCKQCTFVSVTKVEFWEHSRSHIKADKLLTCPKCPFVTEYKHHLEYHLRNHFKSKPFKCNQCPYSCVNKSMLNSHLKSHSDVYQYRCSDCTYATKYCHSLKLHLRKYSHKPAMVLNPDGTPNPEPIIDIYGTRRGPKQHNRNFDKPGDTIFGMIKASHIQTRCMPMFQPHYGAIPPPQQSHGLPLPFPYGPFLNGAFQPNGNGSLLGFPMMNGLPNHKEECASPLADVPLPCLDKMLLTHFNNNNNADEVERHQVVQATPQQQELEADDSDKLLGTPLDLSKAETTSAENPPETSAIVTHNTSSPKNRRKGKAFKLERIAMKLQHQKQSDDEDGDDDTVLQKPPESEDVHADTTSSPQEEPVKSEKTDVQRKNDWKDGVETYDCRYCDITFKDIVMYTVHMGYHGYQDPYKCNMCGQQTPDKVAFFLHIARSSHS